MLYVQDPNKTKRELKDGVVEGEKNMRWDLTPTDDDSRRMEGRCAMNYLGRRLL